MGGGTAFADHEHDDQIKSIGGCLKVCKSVAHHGLGERKEGGPHAEHHDPGG